MRGITRRASWIVCAASGSVLAFTPRAAAAQKPAARTKSPLSAAAILNQSVQASGGAAWEKVKDYSGKGKLFLPAQKITGRFELKAKMPGKMAVIQVLPNLGESRQGFDGKVGWSRDPVSGSRVLSGPELAMVRNQAMLALRPGRWKELYVRTELLGTVKVNGSPAYRVRMTPREGPAETQYFDVRTHLPVRQDSIAATPQGQIPIESYLSDYRTINGVKVPFKMRQIAGKTEIVMQFTEMKTNTALSDSVFTRPR